MMRKEHRFILAPNIRLVGPDRGAWRGRDCLKYDRGNTEVIKAATRDRDLVEHDEGC